MERSGADAIGPLGIAGSVIVAARFGWYQVYGLRGGANVATGATSPLALYLTSTAGRVGTTDVGGDVVIGAINLATSAANAGTVWISYPFATDIAID